MSDSSALERECVVQALHGQNICPTYCVPCWVCGVLHLLTGTLRSVTEGRLDRFDAEASAGRSFSWALADGSAIARIWNTWPDDTSFCIHHSGYSTLDSNYWNGPNASLTSAPVTPAKEGEHGTFQTRQVS